MKVLISIVIGLLVVGCGKKQFTNTNEGNSTPIKTAKKNVEKETPTSTSWISDPSDPNNVKIEAAIRKKLKKPTGEFTKADLEKVTFLNLVYNQLTDVTALKELTQLTRLLLSGNRLTDVTALKELTQLTELHLGSNQLTEVPSGLEKLTQLTRLDLNSNQLTDVTALKELTQLTKLDLGNNQLTDVTALKELTQLKTLWLYNNQLTEMPKGLEKLTQLKELDLNDNPDLTEAQIAELQKALPKCVIDSNAKK